MKMPRFFCPDLSSEEVILEPSESHHLADVLRLGKGECVELFDGKGKSAQAEVVWVRKGVVCLKVKELRCFPSPASKIVLAVSPAKGHRFDFLIEKCTELGVDHILAVVFERTVKMGKESSLGRYEKIAIAATKQSGCRFLPVLGGPRPFLNAVEYLRNEYPSASWIYGDTSSQVPAAVHLGTMAGFLAEKDVVCLIGPEGGFTEAEKETLKSIGACPMQINPNILRIETAAVAFSALLCFLRQ